MQQTLPDRNQFVASQITVYGHTDILSNAFLTFDRLAPGQATVEANVRLLKDESGR
jgi:hypothetical protein